MQIDDSTIYGRIDLNAHRLRMRNALADDMHSFARWDLRDGGTVVCTVGVDRTAMAIVEGGLCWRDVRAERQ
ncbi:hypothetical protein [Agrobacterium vitis]|uniref:hypothetical protein n=1 Tax=Agrobacterium vitis TaxID=373 RepID=UPI00087307E7|nr:hypothetical protein [Agrobacterium vitis]MCM2452966.1 hypothetical protein [Agrobacterium vitis]